MFMTPTKYYEYFDSIYSHLINNIIASLCPRNQELRGKTRENTNEIPKSENTLTIYLIITVSYKLTRLKV